MSMCACLCVHVYVCMYDVCACVMYDVCMCACMNMCVFVCRCGSQRTPQVCHSLGTTHLLIGFFLCVCTFCLHICVCTTCLLVPQEGIRSSGSGVMDCCRPPRGCGESNLDPLREPKAPLATEPSLQSLLIVLERGSLTGQALTK